MIETMHMQENTTTQVTATCPSCGQRGTFTYAGDQPIPPRVAQKLGLAVDYVSLWHCQYCSSTVSEADLGDVAG